MICIKSGPVAQVRFFVGYIITFAIQILYGEVSEWSKEHAWKVCIRQKCIEGSNPSLSANRIKKPADPMIAGFFYFVVLVKIYSATKVYVLPAVVGKS